MNEELCQQGQQDDVREVVMQAAVYCGIPAALDSYPVAEAIFAEQQTGR